MVYLVAYLVGMLVRVLDLQLARMWSPAFFTGTIPIFSYTAKTEASPQATISVSNVERRFEGRLWPSNSVRLKVVNRSVIWFRDDRSMWLASRFRGLMHGKLTHEVDRRRVVATGYADLASVYAWMAMAAFTIMDPGLPMVLADVAFLLIYGAVFAYQGFHLAEFARYVAETLAQQGSEIPTRA